MMYGINRTCNLDNYLPKFQRLMLFKNRQEHQHEDNTK